MPRLSIAISSSPQSARILATQSCLTTPSRFTPLLQAHLRPQPQHPRALPTLLEALALWQGAKVHAVLGVDVVSPRWSSHQLEVVADDTTLYSFDMALVGPHVESPESSRDELGDFADLYRLLEEVTP